MCERGGEKDERENHLIKNKYRECTFLIPKSALNSEALIFQVVAIIGRQKHCGWLSRDVRG